MNNSVVAIDDVVLTKEALQSIKLFREDNGDHEQQTIDEIVNILSDEEPADGDYKRRLALIHELRFISKKIKSLSSPGKENYDGNE